MSRELKTFRASVDPDAEPIPFVLEVQNVRTGEVVRKEEFTALANPGAGADLTVTSIVQFVDGKQVTDLNGLSRFFKRVLIGDGYARLQALLDDQEVGIPTEMLAEVMNYLIEEYAGRPTRPSSASSAGPPATGATSTALPSSTAD